MTLRISRPLTRALPTVWRVCGMPRPYMVEEDTDSRLGLPLASTTSDVRFLPSVVSGSKGCEVFESVGENFQKLPTKVAAAAREVLAKVAQLHQERCEVLLATMRDTGNDDNPAKLWSRLHGASGHHSIASKKPNPLLTASKMQMGMTKSGAHSARGRRSADPTQSRRVTSGMRLLISRLAPLAGPNGSSFSYLRLGTAGAVALSCGPGPEPQPEWARLGAAEPKMFFRLRWMVLGCYGVIYLVSVSLIVRGMTKRPAGFDSKLAAGQKVEDMDAETKASPWCARWGDSLNAALTKIKADQLPQLGFREDMANASADQFEKLWVEEVQAAGPEKASIANVFLKMWPRSKLIMGATAYACQILLLQLYSVYLVRFSLMHFFKLQAWVSEHPFEERNMTNQILVTIFAFSFYSIGHIVLASVTNSINTQLDQRLCGGIAVALFRKAQRLPSTSSSEQTPKEGDAEEGIKADLQTLLNHDVLTALIGCFESCCLAASSGLSWIVLLCLMATELRLASICAFATAIPCLVLAVALGAAVGKCMLTLQERTDRRVVTLREVLFGVRIVKCYGWETAMEEKISNLRSQEVGSLRSYWNITCALTSIMLLFPRLLIWSGLVGYAAIYGAHNVATIFTSLQILACLRGSCEILAQSLAKVAAISPSLTRIQAFLKLPEAPTLQAGQPLWLQHWPSSGGDFVKIQGTYCWSMDSPPAIRQVQLQVPCGELVAVVGGVGSGKSALLQAILGELQPDEREEKAFISRPKTVAYCSQIPHIAEGTLKDWKGHRRKGPRCTLLCKENVLFGQAFDQSRYEDALRAASLGEDLKVLPGGDQVPIGARGISLSGGQKARVSMARAAYHLTSKLVLMDDPFASVDAPTARVIMDKLLLGPLMKGRTCIVSTQPDSDRLQKFQRVVLMQDGKVLLQGTPDVVLASEAYQKLLSSREGGSFDHAEDTQFAKTPAANWRKDGQSTESSLREDEFEGRPSVPHSAGASGTIDHGMKSQDLRRDIELLGFCGHFCR
eukprot:g32154.t1